MKFAVTVMLSVGLLSAGEWQSLFDGQTLGVWTETPFEGRGAVHIENGDLRMGAGRISPL